MKSLKSFEVVPVVEVLKKAKLIMDENTDSTPASVQPRSDKKPATKTQSEG